MLSSARCIREGHACVLVIEDYLPLSRSLCQGLREAGYAVDAAQDGNEGLGLAEGAPYDAIVLGYLRRKIDRGRERALIQTRRGLGYVLGARG